MNSEFECLLQSKVVDANRIYGNFANTLPVQSTQIELREHVAARKYENYFEVISRSHSIPVMDRELGRYSAQIPQPGLFWDSCAAKQLDAGLAVRRERPLDETPYVFLDVRYERVSEGGRLVDCEVLVAVGITLGGHRRMLGVSMALSEAEVRWRAFLDRLVRRDLKGDKLIVSDDHAGLKATRRATLPNVPWQRCQFHLQHNAQAYVTRLDQRKPVVQRFRAIFNAPDDAETERLLKQAVEACSVKAVKAPKFPLWAEDNLPEGCTVCELPLAEGTRLRTTNGLNRINRAIKRRTPVASIFPNAASRTRLVSELLAQCDEDWMTGKIHSNLKD